MGNQAVDQAGVRRTDERDRAGRTALALEGVARRYGRGAGAVHALRGVDVTLPRGTFTAVMGPSGSGKSTLLQCGAGLDRPTSGSVRLGGEELTRMGVRGLTRLRRERVGFVFQSFNLVPTLTAAQNVLLPLRLAGGSRRGAGRERAVRALARVGLADRVASRPGELSGGQQQRVALARALVTAPEVICADEPTGALDPVTAGEVLTLLRESVTELGATVLMVTHDPVAAARADRVLFLADGLVVDELRVDDPGTPGSGADGHRMDGANGGTRAGEGASGPGIRGEAGTTPAPRATPPDPGAPAAPGASPTPHLPAAQHLPPTPQASATPHAPPPPTAPGSPAQSPQSPVDRIAARMRGLSGVSR